MLYFVEGTSKLAKVFSSADRGMLHDFTMQLMAGLGNMLETLLKSCAFGNAKSSDLGRAHGRKRRRSGVDAKLNFKKAHGGQDQII